MGIERTDAVAPKPTMTPKSNHSEVPQHELMLFVFRTTLSVALVWAAIATFGYWRLAQSFGWDKFGLEANISIFAVFTLGGIAVLAGLAYLIYALFRSDKRKNLGQ